MNVVEFAMRAHKDQKRKYTGEPYFGHLAEVAGIVAGIGASYTSVATAWLHDCVEDCGVTYDELAEAFGETVASGVWTLSDLEEGNRTQRKADSRARLATAPDWLQSIKCADLISNTKSIVLHDPKFAVTYLEEKRMLLDVLTKADPTLLAIARGLAN